MQEVIQKGKILTWCYCQKIPPFPFQMMLWICGFGLDRPGFKFESHRCTIHNLVLSFQIKVTFNSCKLVQTLDSVTLDNSTTIINLWWLSSLKENLDDFLFSFSTWLIHVHLFYLRYRSIICVFVKFVKSCNFSIWSYIQFHGPLLHLSWKSDFDNLAMNVNILFHALITWDLLSHHFGLNWGKTRRRSKVWFVVSVDILVSPWIWKKI